MTVRVERRFRVEVPCEEIWAFIADPAKRAGAISVVDDFELDDPDGRSATWYVSLPIPFIDRHVPVETEERERSPPNLVRFVGRSRAMRVEGEHRLRARDGGCEVVNVFVVDGRLPGVERYFKRHLDDELRNLERAMRAELEPSGSR